VGIVGATLLLTGSALALGFVAGRAGRLSPGSADIRAATIAADRAFAGASGEPITPAAQVAPPDTAGISFGVVEPGIASIGEPAPEFTLPDLDGAPVSLDDYRGSPVLLNFFATWCAPCRLEMPHLQAAYEEHAAEGLVVLAIDLQESPELVRGYMDELGLTFPAVLDSDSVVSLSKYRVGTLPTSVLIDREGEVALISQRYYASRADLEADLRFILVE
jgi:peroxiredoxin